MEKDRNAWLTEWKNYKPEMFVDEPPHRETWYAVSWKEIYFDTNGKMLKRYHQYNYQTKAGAEKVVASLKLHRDHGRVDNVKMEPIHFDKPIEGKPRRES